MNNTTISTIQFQNISIRVDTRIWCCLSKRYIGKKFQCIYRKSSFMLLLLLKKKTYSWRGQQPLWSMHNNWEAVLWMPLQMRLDPWFYTLNIEKMQQQPNNWTILSIENGRCAGFKRKIDTKKFNQIFHYMVFAMNFEFLYVFL